MSAAALPAVRVTRLIDIVFPGDTNHHGTLFGGVGLAHMDKVAFIAASRHGQVDFVTASCERIDFEAPAQMGDIVELAGHVVRVGRRSLSVEVDMIAEHPLSGTRRFCGRGVFNMVAVGDGLDERGGHLPPLNTAWEGDADGDLKMVEMVFPGVTSHYGSLFGGNALAAMEKAAFVAATRHCRKAVVMASSQRVDFEGQIDKGEVVELEPSVVNVGRTSMTVDVQMWGENLLSGQRRFCGKGRFVMVAVDAQLKPTEVLPSVA